MKPFFYRLIYGFGLIAFAGSLFIVGKIPAYTRISEIGKQLLSEAGLCFEEGQDVASLVCDMLGGEPFYMGKEAEQSEQALVLEENQVTVPENEEEVENNAAGDVFHRENAEVISQAVPRTVKKDNVYVNKLKSSLDVNYLWDKFYIVDSTTSVTKKIFDVKKMLAMNFKLNKKKGKKQVLIYHTHGASEAYSDSRKGKKEDSVIGVGSELTKVLEERGYGVYHDTKQYDSIGGRIDRSLAYNKSLEGITAILKQNPDIEVVIDLHRDSVGAGKHTYTTIDGKKTALVMFFNGMSRTRSGEIAYLYNPNLEGNLAFGLQMKCKAMEYYEGFTKPIYLKGYRYNLHLKKRSLLIEWGNENNTVAEAKNAAAPLADVLDKVLSGVD